MDGAAHVGFGMHVMVEIILVQENTPAGDAVWVASRVRAVLVKCPLSGKVAVTNLALPFPILGPVGSAVLDVLVVGICGLE